MGVAADGVRIKFARAELHAQELRKQIADYLQSSPFEPYEEEEASSGDLIVRVRVQQNPPLALGGIIGDVIHNLRAALDQITWNLVLANGHTPNTSTQFPVGKDQSDFGKAVKSRLKGVSSDALNLVKDLRVYPTGDEKLWTLHRLDIADKHRTLIPVGASHEAVNVMTTFAGFDNVPLNFPAIAIRPADRQYPLKDGAEIFRVMKAARGGPADWQRRFSFTFTVAFGDGAPVAGEPIDPMIPDLVSYVQQKTQPLLALIETV